MTADNVTFHWRAYRHHDKRKQMTLTSEEFIRRFLLHVLPDGFQRIRHYGFLSNCHRQDKLTLCRRRLGMVAIALLPLVAPRDYRTHYEQLTGDSLARCPACGQGRRVTVATLAILPGAQALVRRDTS
jgi:Putative transposase